jgi:class 3 adenylate cyclase/tetratricopeptide (TPR) repeat protein
MNRDDSLKSTKWASFLPGIVTQRLIDYAALNLVGQEGRVPACALFLDIAGFTPMSEALATRGSYGTEELTTILNNCFGSMIELVVAYGGDIAGFGGDSLIAFFPVSGARNGPALRRAVQCAFDVQNRMKEFASLSTTAGEFALRIRAGVCTGDVLWIIVGDPDIRLTCLVAGRPLEKAADAAGFGTQREIVVSASDVNTLAHAEWGRSGAQGSVIRALATRSRPSKSTTSVPDLEASSLRVFVHPRIADLLETGHIHFVNEHRRVSVMFVGFRRPDYDNDINASKKLQRYFLAASRIIERRGGYLEQIETADKGSKYIALFGAPIARENNVERALDCALDICKLDDVEPRIGITTGHVYCGLIGSHLRQEYVVIGDPVNLAARLMQRATPQSILVDELTRNEAGSFRWGKSAAISVKGKRRPVTIARLRSKKPLEPPQERTYDLPIVGRKNELRKARRILEQVSGGRGQVIQLSGVAGIGKSRLGAEIMRSAMEMGFTTLGGTCRLYGATTGYAVWQPIIRGLLQLPLGRLQRHQIEGLKGKLAAFNPSYVGRLPLLAPVLGVEIPDTKTTAGLDIEMRLQSMKSLVLDLLRQRSRRTPLGVLMEDSQWLDQPSEDLLEIVARNISDMTIALLIVSRVSHPDETPLPAMRLHNSSHIYLTGLSESEAEQLATLKLRSLGPTGTEAAGDVSGIAHKGQGNPFYIEEIINFLHGPTSASRKAETVPDTLNSLIMARLDDLSDQERTALKVASVIGRTFTAESIAGAYPLAGPEREVLSTLGALERLDLTPKRSTEPDAPYTFKHGLIQEVAYGSLTFDARAMLHERTGAFIEGRYPNELSQYIEDLAHHYGHSRNNAKQLIYFPLAADLAKDNFANDSAIRYYERLLPLLSTEEQGGVLRKLGEVLQLVGRWDEAEQAYRRALDIAQARRATNEEAEAQAALGYLLSYTQSFDKSLPWLEKAHRAFRTVGDSQGVIRVLEYLSHSHFELGHFRQAIESASAQLKIASEAGDRSAESLALENLGRTHWHSGDRTLALHYLHRALSTAEEGKNRKAIIHACNDVAGLYSEMGDGETAMHFLARALSAANEIGYRLLSGITIGNAGHLYRERGQSDLARRCYVASLAIGVELGHLAGVFVTLGELASLSATEDEDDVAEELFRLSARLGRELNNPFFLCEFLYHWSEFNFNRGRLDRATELLEEALALTIRLERNDYLLRCLLLKSHLDLALGRTSLDVVESSMENLLDEWDADDERAAIHYQLWEIASKAHSRVTAADIYLNLYNFTSIVDYKKRFERLTGEVLAEPEPLPPLDVSSAGLPPKLETVLARVSELLFLQTSEVA